MLNRPYIIDVEASGFGAWSYPIEVGVAMRDNEKYCALISPAPEWTYWDETAEELHRVRRDVLEAHGKPRHVVTDDLNGLLEGKTVYSDGWVVDKPWLTTLFFSAGKPMKFQISPLELILSEPQMAQWHKVKDEVVDELKLTRHRASYDAWVIQETYRRTLAGAAT